MRSGAPCGGNTQAQPGLGGEPWVPRSDSGVCLGADGRRLEGQGEMVACRAKPELGLDVSKPREPQVRTGELTLALFLGRSGLQGTTGSHDSKDCELVGTGREPELDREKAGQPRDFPALVFLFQRKAGSGRAGLPDTFQVTTP